MAKTTNVSQRWKITHKRVLLIILVAGLLIITLPFFLVGMTVFAYVALQIGIPFGICVLIYYAQVQLNKERKIDTPQNKLISALVVVYFLAFIVLYLSLFYSGSYNSSIAQAQSSASDMYPGNVVIGAVITTISTLLLFKGSPRIKGLHYLFNRTKLSDKLRFKSRLDALESTIPTGKLDPTQGISRAVGIPSESEAPNYSPRFRIGSIVFLGNRVVGVKAIRWARGKWIYELT